MTGYSKLLINTNYDLESFGNVGANWWLPKNYVTPKSIIYSIGVGEDISFDTALIDTYACKVYGFDPTPRAAEYVKKHSIKNFLFISLGVWKTNSIVKFFEPANNQHVSHSIVNLQRTTKYFKAACLTLRSIMERLHHTHIDVLKLDIEGAEFIVMAQFLADSVFPKIIAVEFDQPCKLKDMMDCMENLKSRGYLLIKQDHFNFVFIHAV